MFISGENCTNCQKLYILSNQKFVKTVQQSNSKHFRMMCNLFYFFVFLKKFDFDPDPDINPDPELNPDPESSRKSDPEIIFPDPTH